MRMVYYLLRVLHVRVYVIDVYFLPYTFVYIKKLVLIESFSKLNKICSKIDGYEITALDCYHKQRNIKTEENYLYGVYHFGNLTET